MRASIEVVLGVVFFAWMRRAFYLSGLGCFWFDFLLFLLLAVLLCFLRWYPDIEALCVDGLVCAALLCAGIRELLSSFTRRPCAGRHLLFFAAAKKSRQKKAAHTANS
ncbi:hypothetical protein [Paraburkholderia caribensis]|uniref:hypothetical protein n=1 Tax=Paraburkholderia caribensis TaxID=75105 RepID=UPI0028576788|nr:hypothetical protein [Paraburkholderia caribensis]MDR6381356.1 hypothetical protein [Paraburkholderia caribensis]